MCTCEEIERGTYACKASKLGPVERWWTQDGKLGLTIQDSPPEVWNTDTFIVFYLFVLHSVTCLKTCRFAACFTMLWTSISVFYVNTARDVVTVLLIFAKYHHFSYTFSHAHTEAHTQMYNRIQKTRHRSLGGRKALLKTLHTHQKKCQEKNRYARI